MRYYPTGNYWLDKAEEHWRTAVENVRQQLRKLLEEQYKYEDWSDRSLPILEDIQMVAGLHNFNVDGFTVIEAKRLEFRLLARTVDGVELRLDFKFSK